MRIDVHHHVLPPEYVASLARVSVTSGGGVAFPRWDAASTLEMMDRQGIAAAVTSISAPGVHFGDDVAARGLARRCNELSARLVADHPTRFGAFAVLTLPDVKGALHELEHALDELGLDGVVLLASQSDGRYLGDPLFDDLLAELDRRAAVVLVHPAVPKSSEALPLDLPEAMVEFTFDTTRAALNLVFRGATARFPNVRYILSHAGGTIPYLAGRIALTGALPGLRERVPDGPLPQLRRFYYDTALSATPHALRSLRELVGSDRILFGSDFPFAPEAVARASIDGLARYDGFDDAGRRRIDGANALELLPRLAARVGVAR
ncbi:MAG TPA: amidohydrolase family protein [Myxococcota bacterium]|nr:amidohydrolase family protein [Myxococcota bacterium]